ncbi:MAG: DUF4867 family protein [Oscillospiraceae bacterium]|nr:DUF4867 family protein [Oscillospiraceae bacterium]
MKIYSVTDREFIPYGQPLREGYDVGELLKKMEAIELPGSGTAYRPGIESLESCAVFGDFRDRAFGGLPIQLGMCWGRNTKLNCLEYHRSSEINLGSSPFILLLARREEIEDGMLDTDRVKAFRVPAGLPVELYATTLHFAPCQVPGEDGFRVAVVLPKGTNTDKPVFTAKNEEDGRMTACNKWLLAHPESKQAAGGAPVGLRGRNIDLSEEL